MWRKGYDKEGRWTRKNFAYIDRKGDGELLDELQDSGDLGGMTVVELKALFKKCALEPPPKRAQMITRLRKLMHALAVNTGRSEPKRKQHPSDTTMPRPRRKRRKRGRKGAADAVSREGGFDSGPRFRGPRPAARSDSPPHRSGSSGRATRAVAPTSMRRASTARLRPTSSAARSRPTASTARLRPAPGGSANRSRHQFFTPAELAAHANDFDMVAPASTSSSSAARPTQFV